MPDAGHRTIWGSKLGFLLAAIGSAIGLGNIWRFSYVAYENGGGAFLVPYIFAMIIAGAPLMILEFSLGHREKGASPLAFSRIDRRLEWIGWWMPTVASVGILLFYSVVVAWCLNYFFYSFTLGWGVETQDFFLVKFLNSSNDPYDLGGIRLNILGCSALVWLIAWAICFKEVNHGIEKACLVFMPLLVLLTAILVFWSLSLEGAMAGIRHYLKPDWDKINVLKHYADKDVWSVWLSAFGQIFFSLSLGFGIMITYASYLPRKTDIVRNGLITVLANCFYSFFAGFAVFGTLGFMALQQGKPISEVVMDGGGLAFIAYPEAINQLPFGNRIFGAAFFLTLVIAGLSSVVSLVEAFVCAVTDKFSYSRGRAITVFCVVGFVFSSIFTTRGGLAILDIVDHFINQYGLLVGGLLECLVVGWVLKASVARHHVNSIGLTRLVKVWDYCIKYVTPAILGVILLQAAKNDILNPYKSEDYPVSALFVYGAGVVFLTLGIAVYLSTRSWKRARHFHKPQEEHVLT